jgi:hypothetical protein
MQSSEIIIIASGTILFFGFAVWMAFYSRRKTANDRSQPGQPARQVKNTGKSDAERGWQ